MHRFRSGTTIRRMRLTAFVVLATTLLVPVSGLLLFVSYVLNRHELLVAGLYVMSLTVFMLILRWAFTLRTRCPLCMARVMAKNPYSSHRRAKMIFGSHRLRVALSVLLRNGFTCPYCNERAHLKLRE